MANAARALRVNGQIGLLVRDCTVLRDSLCRGSQHTLAIMVLMFIRPLPVYLPFSKTGKYYEPHVNMSVSFFYDELVDDVW